MKKMIPGFILMAIVVSAGLGAPVPGEKGTQISLGGNLLMLKNLLQPMGYIGRV